jgi:hypothetical protein
MPMATSKQVISKKGSFPRTPERVFRSWRVRNPWQTRLPGQNAASGRRVGAARVLMAVAFSLTLLLVPPTLPAQESLKTYQTQYVVISYADEKDLYTFTRNIGSGMSFLWENQEQNPLLAKTRVDKIVESICSILDMYPPNLRFGITLYKTQAEVTAAYKALGATGAAPVAFYAHRTRNIAVAIDSITDGILAHEIAHAIISAYFVPPPPGRMQEILAQYMDKHFRDR